MFIIKLMAVFTTLYGYSCQNQAGGQNGYFQILQQGQDLTNGLQMMSGGNILSSIGSIFQNYQDEIIGYAGQTLLKGLEAVSPNDTDSRCLNHTELFVKALLRRENWALKMIDAFGKPGTGLLDYNFNWVGNFDECIAIQATEYKNLTTKEDPSSPYSGKYCTATFALGAPSNLGQFALNFGLCVPDSCSQKDISGLVNAVAGVLPLNMTIPEATAVCQERTLEFTDKALAVSIVGAVFVGLILIATVYDVFVQHVLSRQAATNQKRDCYIKSSAGIANRTFEHPVSVEEMVKDYTKDVQNDKYRDGFTETDMTTSDQMQAQASAYKPGIPGKLLLSFSIYTNASKILNTKQPKGTLTCVNGIRFLSMTWVILGHTISFGILQLANAATFSSQMFKRFTFQAILNATVSVDTFFVLSGLLVSYLSLREMKKRGGALKFNWGLFYFHRYWRLTPPYMLLLMLYVPTIKYWADGPFWLQNGIDLNECSDSWWKNLVYINNVYLSNTLEQCMGWSWYLANDMQFYVISPVMLIPLFYSPVAGGVACFALILANFICSGIISSHFDANANILFSVDNDQSMINLYFSPWTRIGPYVVGFFTGYVLYKTECKVKMSKITNLVGWTVATAVAMSVLYGLYTPDGSAPGLGKSVSALYNATSRTAWGLSVAWVIFACATGYGGPVNALLSWRGVIPLSRLTYSAYLVHPLVLFVYYNSRRTLMYWDDLEMAYTFLSNLCVSYAAAFVLSLAFESPMMGLEKVLLGRRKNS